MFLKRNNIGIKILIMMFLILLFFPIYTKADDQEEEEYKQNEIEELIIESATKPLEEPIINARAAIIYDRKTKEKIWGKNEMDKKAMASTTKIMTAIVVLENSNLSDVVTISKKAAGTGGSKLKISAGDKITVKDLLYGLMLRSGNDSAVALAEYVGNDLTGFSEMMNKKAKELGLSNTNFVTPHGLDDQNHYTTAYELAILTDYALENEMFRKIVNTKMATITINGNSRNIYNTNELLGVLAGVDGVKTGFTNNAGRCLVTSCTRDGNQIIVVVLGCDTKKQRTSDSTKLIEYGFKNYIRVNLEEKIQKEFENWKQINSKRIYINKAKVQEIELKLEEIVKKEIPIKINEQNDITIEINAIYQYEAPVEKGQKIGNVIVKNKEEIVESVDIICSKTIEKQDIFSYMIQLISIIPQYEWIK